MRAKTYFLAASLCCMLPFMAQGTDLVTVDPPPGPPRSPLRSMPTPPVTIETESGLLTLYFTGDLGEVYVLIEQAGGKMAYSQLVDTAMQDQASFMIPAETYILTVIDTTGNIIRQESVVIPS